mgnify:CR=1 FL=1
MTNHRKACCNNCVDTPSDWITHTKSLPTGYANTVYQWDITKSTEGGSQDYEIETVSSVDFHYPLYGKGACGSTNTETFTGSCDSASDCVSGSPYLGYDNSFTTQDFDGEPSYYELKTIGWNDPDTKRYVADATVVTAFDVTWDSNKAFGGGCSTTTLGIKRCTLEVTSGAGGSLLFRIYWQAGYIWKYTFNMHQEMEEFSNAINAQTNASESWSLGIEATAGSSNITSHTSVSGNAGLIAQAEQTISTSEAVTIQHYRPDKLGLQTGMGWEVDPTFLLCDDYGDYNWTAQSDTLLQRTTSASWVGTAYSMSDYSGNWTAVGLGGNVNSATVTFS